MSVSGFIASEHGEAIGLQATRIDVAVSEAFEVITKAAEKGRLALADSDKVLTGLRDADDAIDGILPGELAIVTGQSQVGKSAFALTVAANAANGGASVLVVSPGSREIDVASRMLSAESRVDSRKIVRGAISAGDWESLADAANKVSSYDIRICCHPQPTARDVAEIARNAFQGAGKALIVFDGIEWMASENGVRSWPYMAMQGAFQLKTIAKEQGVCTLATMAPAPRPNPMSAWSEVAHPEDRLLSLMGVESVADIVILLAENKTPNPCERRSLTSGIRIVKATIAKSRRAPLTAVDLAYVPHWGRFIDLVDDSGLAHKRQDDRVGDIALELGWDRQSVVDALECLNEEDEKKAVFSSYEEMTAAIRSFADLGESSEDGASAHDLVRSEVELSPLEARRHVSSDPGLRFISIRSSTDWGWLYVLERWDFRCASCGHMVELDLDGKVVTSETVVADKQEWAFEIGRRFLDATPNWHSDIRENDLGLDEDPPEGERECPYCGATSVLRRAHSHVERE